MANQVASLQEALVAAFESQMSNMYTAIPCIVVAVKDNLNTQMVDIQPTINQKMKDGTTRERTIIMGVPVVFPVSKTAGFTFPISVGDTGLAVFSMRNMDAWKNGNGRPSSPLNFAKMDKGDAIFIPGLQPMSVAVNNPNKRVWQHSTSDAVLVNNIGSSNEAELRIKPDGSVMIRTNGTVSVECDTAEVLANSSVSVTTPEITIDAASTTWVGNANITGTWTFNGIPFDTHKHSGVTPGGGTSGGPVP